MAIEDTIPRETISKIAIMIEIRGEEGVASESQGAAGRGIEEGADDEQPDVLEELDEGKRPRLSSLYHYISGD